jgi:hypothetical protein
MISFIPFLVHPFFFANSRWWINVGELSGLCYWKKKSKESLMYCIVYTLFPITIPLSHMKLTLYNSLAREFHWVILRRRRCSDHQRWPGCQQVTSPIHCSTWNDLPGVRGHLLSCVDKAALRPDCCSLHHCNRRVTGHRKVGTDLQSNVEHLFTVLWSGLHTDFTEETVLRIWCLLVSRETSGRKQITDKRIYTQMENLGCL